MGIKIIYFLRYGVFLAVLNTYFTTQSHICPCYLQIGLKLENCFRHIPREQGFIYHFQQAENVGQQVAI